MAIPIFDHAYSNIFNTKFVRNKINKKKEIKNNNKEIKSLRKENSYPPKRLEKMDAVLDRQEQCSSLNCLLIQGVDEVEKKDTEGLTKKVIEKHMNQQIKSEDIDRSQRLGKPKKSRNAKSQTIIVKFIRYDTRNKICMNKKF